MVTIRSGIFKHCGIGYSLVHPTTAVYLAQWFFAWLRTRKHLAKLEEWLKIVPLLKFRYTANAI